METTNTKNENKTKEEKTMKIETLYPGNIALEEHKITLTLEEGKRVRQYLKTEMKEQKGGYYYDHVIRPVNRAARKHADNVILYTAGFSTGELCSILAIVGIRR